MEEFPVSAEHLEEPVLDIPEAIQTPTKPVSLLFMVALTAAGTSLYILYTGIGALLLPFQFGLLAPADKVVVLGVFTPIAVVVAPVAKPRPGALRDPPTSAN